MEDRTGNSAIAKVMPDMRQRLKSMDKPKNKPLLGSLLEEKTRRILVVDDTKAIRDVLSDMLSIMGYEVVVASSGHEGLNRFLKSSFELVLTDLDMPGIDGCTLALHIKDKSPNTPVVLMTGSEEEAVIKKLRASCVDSIIFKPFRLEEIEKTVERIIVKGPSECKIPLFVKDVVSFSNR